MSEKKFSMGRRPDNKVESEIDELKSTEVTEEPIDRVNFELPRSLRLRFNQEAARRDMKKRDLVREIFDYYFADK